jgi:hypothetical protein
MATLVPLDPSDPRNPSHPCHEQQWIELAGALGEAMADYDWDRMHANKERAGSDKAESGGGLL